MKTLTFTQMENFSGSNAAPNCPAMAFILGFGIGSGQLEIAAAAGLAMAAYGCI
jgi:hypothetical protein